MELLKIISKLLNISEAKAQEFIDQDDEDAVVKLNADNLKKRFDEGHKKATGQGLKDLVKVFSTEFDFDITGTTPEEIIASVKTGFENRDPGEISETAIKASSSYKKLQSELTRATQDVNNIVEKKVKEAVKIKEQEFEVGIKKAKRESFDPEIFIRAEKWLVKNNAILSQDPEKRYKQIKELADRIKALDVDKDGSDFLISKEGLAVTNKEGHNASLEDVFQDYDYLYNFQEVQQRNSTGLPPNGIQGGGPTNFKHFKGEVPKDDAGMNQVYLDYGDKKLSKEAFHEVKAAYAEQTAK